MRTGSASPVSPEAPSSRSMVCGAGESTPALPAATLVPLSPGARRLFSVFSLAAAASTSWKHTPRSAGACRPERAPERPVRTPAWAAGVAVGTLADAPPGLASPAPLGGCHAQPASASASAGRPAPRPLDARSAAIGSAGAGLSALRRSSLAAPASLDALRCFLRSRDSAALLASARLPLGSEESSACAACTSLNLTSASSRAS